MTRTRHLDDEALITIARDHSPSASDTSHVDSCTRCAHELEGWRRISDLATVSIDLVPSAKEDLAQRVFGELDRPRRNPVSPRMGRLRAFRGWSRGGRWVIAVPIVIAGLVLALTLGFESSSPSDAMVLESIRSSPGVAAMSSQTVHWTALEVDRAPQGFIDIEYRTHGAADPRTNAFVDTTKAIIPGGDPHFASSTTVSDGSLVYLPCDANLGSYRQEAVSRVSSAKWCRCRLPLPDLSPLRQRASGPAGRTRDRRCRDNWIQGERAGQRAGSERDSFRALTRSIRGLHDLERPCRGLVR